MSNSYRDEQVLAEHERRWLEPDPDPDPVRYCDYCGEPMYEGDTIWKIGCDWICEDCARSQFAEVLRDD